MEQISKFLLLKLSLTRGTLYNGHSCRINQKETRQRDVCRSNFRNIRNWPFNCTKSHRRIPSVKQTPTGLPLLDNPVLYSPYKNSLNIVAFATSFNSIITVMANCQCPESLMTTDTNIHCTSPHKRPLYGDIYDDRYLPTPPVPTVINYSLWGQV